MRDGPVGNDGTDRTTTWRRYDGDEWAAFDSLPARVRRRMNEHAYDAWAVNALMLWRRYRLLHTDPRRAERALLRYLDHCERLERRMFSEAWTARFGTPLPHTAARASVLRYEAPRVTAAAMPQGLDEEEVAASFTVQP